MNSGRSKSGRRRTLCHADLDNFIQSIDSDSCITKQKSNDIEIDISPQYHSVVSVEQNPCPVTEIDLIRKFCKVSETLLILFLKISLRNMSIMLSN